MEITKIINYVGKASTVEKQSVWQRLKNLIFGEQEVVLSVCGVVRKQTDKEVTLCSSWGLTEPYRTVTIPFDKIMASRTLESKEELDEDFTTVTGKSNVEVAPVTFEETLISPDKKYTYTDLIVNYPVMTVNELSSSWGISKAELSDAIKILLDKGKITKRRLAQYKTFAKEVDADNFTKNSVFYTTRELALMYNTSINVIQRYKEALKLLGFKIKAGVAYGETYQKLLDFYGSKTNIINAANQFTQKQICEKVGIHQSTYSKLIRKLKKEGMNNESVSINA